MTERHTEQRRTGNWPIAIRKASRWFGLSGHPNVGAMRLAAVLIVLGAALLAAGGRAPIGYLGGGMWIIGAVIAARGYVRLMRSRATKPS
jgi:hypothetical protein